MQLTAVIHKRLFQTVPNQLNDIDTTECLNVFETFKLHCLVYKRSLWHGFNCEFNKVINEYSCWYRCNHVVYKIVKWKEHIANEALPDTLRNIFINGSFNQVTANKSVSRWKLEVYSYRVGKHYILVQGALCFVFM